MVYAHTGELRQDLNSSILTGSHRIFGLATFPELHWARDPYLASYFCLPVGFQGVAHLFPGLFVTVLEDLNGLQCIRDRASSTAGGTSDMVLMAQINNHAASIQSRLNDLSDPGAVAGCCCLAAYVCSVVLCCKVLCGLVTHVRIGPWTQ